MKHQKVSKRKNYYFFIGTEAELIKVFPVIHEFQKRHIPFKIIVSGQNDITTSHLFSQVLHTKPDIFLSHEKIKQTAFGLIWWFVKTFFHGLGIVRKEWQEKKEPVIIVHGDTVSTVMGALLGKIQRIPVVHIEAGLRSFHFFQPFPEEIDRVIVSLCVDYHFCPNEWAVNNIKQRKGMKINTQANTLYDSLQYALKSNEKLPWEVQRLKNGYGIFILHRQENLMNKQLVESFITTIEKTAKKFPCVFVIHSPTRVVLEKYGLLERLKKNTHIVMLERMNYFVFMKLFSNANFIITDGGSNQEEASYLGKPTLILRSFTERIEGLGENVLLFKNNTQLIDQFIERYDEYQRNQVTFKKNPSSIICDYLEKIME